MLLKKYAGVAALIFLITIPYSSDAANLRGQIVGRNQISAVPYAIGGAAADLYVQGPQGWLLVERYITGSDGMYFFVNILPGNYVLQINGRQNYPITVFNQPSQDLPPVVIQY